MNKRINTDLKFKVNKKFVRALRRKGWKRKICNIEYQADRQQQKKKESD